MDNRCPFCDPDGILFENELSYSIYDSFPVSRGHTLIIPKRHLGSFFDLDKEELAACYDMIRRVKEHIDSRFCPDAYNIGINVGRSAGQSIMHVHIHLIPRYRGDVPRAKGGVRGVIRDKQEY